MQSTNIVKEYENAKKMKKVTIFWKSQEEVDDLDACQADKGSRIAGEEGPRVKHPLVKEINRILGVGQDSKASSLLPESTTR